MELETAVEIYEIDARLRALVETLHRDLHALCQPLTALHCGLELGRRNCEPAELIQAVDGGLEECRRIFAVVSRMRSTLRAEDALAAELAQSAGPMN